MLDAAQILQMEHSFNCGHLRRSRLCQHPGPYPVLYLCLHGHPVRYRLHGGADQAALEMASGESAARTRPRPTCKDCLADKVKIMGMGHREYRTVDPRAKSAQAHGGGAVPGRTRARTCWRRWWRSRRPASSEFSATGTRKSGPMWSSTKAPCSTAWAFRRHFFTAMFAMARVYGYIAHFLEFQTRQPPDSPPRLLRWQIARGKRPVRSLIAAGCRSCRL